jgi:hypothetical protein
MCFRFPQTLGESNDVASLADLIFLTATLTCPIQLCCPREIRGAVVASYQLMITIGILVSNLINYGVREI